MSGSTTAWGGKGAEGGKEKRAPAQLFRQKLVGQAGLLCTLPVPRRSICLSLPAMHGLFKKSPHDRQMKLG